MRQIDLAWAAGLFDGEGCIRIRRHELKSTPAARSVHHHLVVDLSNNHKPSVERFAKIVGMSDCKLGVRSARGNQQASWKFRVTSRKALKVIQLLHPYLYTKREQADLAVEFARLIGPKGYGGKRTPPELVSQRQDYMERLSRAKKQLEERTA